MFRDNSWNNRKTFKRLNPGSDCFKNRCDPVYSYFGRRGIHPEGSLYSVCGLLSAWSRSSCLRQEHSQHSWAPASQPTRESGDGKGWGANIHARWWAQGSLIAISQSPGQQGGLQGWGGMPCDVLCLHISAAPWEGRAASASVHCHRSAPVTQSHQARAGYCLHLSAVKTELKMQQSSTGALSYCQEQLNPNFESTCLPPQEAVSVSNWPDAK